MQHAWGKMLIARYGSKNRKNETDQKDLDAMRG
jgi:hypothetical protein